ncbi:MAG: transposase [Bacilli bacterium]|nr:transposase [Bacilli bacterium]
MSKTYKSFDEDFKKTLVSLYESGKKISDLGREYGVNESTIRSWITKYGTITTSAGETTTNDEIIKLQKRNHELEQENEILKKAVAIFSKK